MAEYHDIPSFYAGKTIFITGTTGFIGKILMWKLLQSCPLIQKIYILLRAKKGSSIECRKMELLNSPIFNNFKAEGKQHLLNKICAISGDISLPNLGLSQEDTQKLIDEVFVIFYSAAHLKMNASLKEAININTGGVCRCISLAEQMKQLSAFVYVSTAYCCCDESLIEEKLYPINMKPTEVISISQNISPKILDKIAPDIMNPLPNAYIFSKRITEGVLAEYQGKLSIIIARPTIGMKFRVVVPALIEPMPGWADSLNGVIGLSVAGATGLLRSIYGDPAKKTNLIPVDVVCNCLIAIPWGEAQKQQKTFSIPVYNLASPESAEISWDSYMKICKRVMENFPFYLMLWFPNRSPMTKCLWWHKIQVVLFHYGPALLIDSILFLLRKKIFMMKVQRKISDGAKVIAYFLVQQWVFKIEGIESLQKLMNKHDSETFPLVFYSYNYYDAIYISAMNIKKYVLKEDDPAGNIWKARLKFKLLFYIDAGIRVLLCFMALKIIFSYMFTRFL